MKGRSFSMLFNMFKSKNAEDQQKQSLIHQSRRMNPSIQVKKGSSLETQLNLLSLTEYDLAIAQSLKPYVEENIDQIVNAFYENIEKHPQLINIINDNSSIERLKCTLKNHIIEIFSGIINEEFLVKRKRIAMIHVKIGLTQKWYIASFRSLYDSILEVLYETFSSEQDRKIGMKAVYKLLNLEEQIVLEAYDEEIMILKEQESAYQKEIIHSVTEVSSDFTLLVEETMDSIENITTQINLVTSKSQTGTQMAIDAEEVSKDGRAGLGQMQDSLEGLESSTLEVTSKMIDLERMSQEIKSIIGIVKTIAEQTNLLSLNASIEAARAGEEGRGFAVVAKEVRNLAMQTEEAVRDVTELVNEINCQVDDSSHSLQAAKGYLTKVQEHMTGTASYFHSINDQMEKTKEINMDMQDDLESMEELTDVIVNAATSTSASAGKLNEILERPNV